MKKSINIADYLAELAHTTPVTSERQKEIVGQILLGINWLNETSPSWFLRLTKPADMDDRNNNPKAQILGTRMKAVLEPKEVEVATGEFDTDLRRGFALVKGELDEEVVLRNLLWTAAAALQKMQRFDNGSKTQIIEIEAAVVVA